MIKQKLIIALYNRGTTGKSTTIKKVYEKLKSGFPEISMYTYYNNNLDQGDISIMLFIKNILIGIESQGDPGSRVLRSIPTFVENNCDIILCATRTRGETVKVVQLYEKEFEIKWIKKEISSTESGCNSSNEDQANIIYNIIKDKISALNVFLKKSHVTNSKWNIQKIDSYINHAIEESIHLDYKSSGALFNKPEKKKEITKDVSAFANSDGGVIIYGVKENTKLKHLPEKIDPIDGRAHPKEWLEHIVNSINPRIEGVLIHPIQIATPALNKIVYVVEIPKSNTIHQAKDHRYYKRFNFESIPMEDWEVKDVLNRRKEADLDVLLIPTRHDKIFKEWIDKGNVFDFDIDIYITNKGNIGSMYVECFLIVEKHCESYIKDSDNKSVGNQIKFSNSIDRKIEIDGDSFIIATDRVAILPKTRHFLGTFKISSKLLIDEEKLEILITTHTGSNSKTLKGVEIIQFRESK